ncbi:sensor domain-containing diguanylate cyclase [Leeia oryzae]|uniref:sensor domain-containing diguanylate cyclase n=1 Tax=Leeia oryzae TaxID=356662 RepID=UPI0003A59F56|nr:sensor domain-containing diguanylate cyclase [Leeia oryzae]
MKLARLFAISLFFLMVLIALLLSHIMIGDWHRYATAREGLDAMQLVTKAMVAAEKVSFERGPSNGLMGDDIPHNPERSRRLFSARRASDQALADLLATVSHSANPRVRATAGLIQQAQRQLAIGRNAVEKVATLPRDQRQPGAIHAAIQQMFDVVPPVLTSVNTLTHNAVDIYPEFADVLNSAQFSVYLREYAGRLGSQFTVALTRNVALSKMELTNINQLRGRIEQIRQLIELPTTKPDMDKRVRDAVQNMEQHYFGKGLAFVNSVEDNSEAHRPYGMDAAIFAQHYVPEMASIVRLRNTLLAVAVEGARHTHTLAKRDLIISCIVGTGVLLTLILLLILLRQRIVQPVLYATQALIDIANGKPGDKVPYSPRRDEVGKMLNAVEVVRVNSIEKLRLEAERNRLTEALHQSHELYRLVAENTNDVIWLMDLTTQRLKFVSPSVKHLRGWTAEEMLNLPAEQYYTPDVRSKLDAILHDAIDRYNHGELPARFLTMEVEVPHKDGHLVPVEITGTLMFDEPDHPQLLGVTRNISERKAAEQEIKHMAFYDKLTSLPNRRLLEDRLNRAIASAKRNRHLLALMFIDLDKFKPINDEMGHDTGDWLLQRVAERMQQCLRNNDTVARVGGDEFVVLLPDINDIESAANVGNKILEAMNTPFVTELGKSLHISSSIGIVLYPEHADNARDLLRQGDVAMYRAKQNGRNAVCIFSPDD